MNAKTISSTSLFERVSCVKLISAQSNYAIVTPLYVNGNGMRDECSYGFVKNSKIFSHLIYFHIWVFSTPGALNEDKEQLKITKQKKYIPSLLHY